MSIIRCENLTRKYKTGDTTVFAVKGVTLEIPRGVLTVLRGKSGSGKTTLINIMGALDYPDEGSVIFDGQNIVPLGGAQRDAIRRGKMGFVFQSVALIGEMTAYENIDFSLRVNGMPSKQRKARVQECLEMVGLGKRGDHLPQELSGGEQQRVAIARAVAHRPPVVFADEPTAQLDSQMGMQIMRLFFDLTKIEGVTVVMTTHDPEIIDIADNVYTLRDGEISDEY